MKKEAKNPLFMKRLPKFIILGGFVILQSLGALALFHMIVFQLHLLHSGHRLMWKMSSYSHPARYP